MKPAQLCVTVTADTTADLRTRRDAAAGAELVELRLDTVSDPDPAAALADRRTPVIVTCRHRAEGGYFDGSEEERRRILREAIRLGAEFVDVEWNRACADLIQECGGERIVLSHHDFSGVPRDLADKARAMLGAGAGTVKLSATAHRLTDNLTLREVGRNATTPVVLVGMGIAGVPSRVLASWMGSRWTYSGDGVAPGQVPPSLMRGQFRFHEIGPNTAIYGVVGKPVTHSVSPAMHNAAFAAAHFDAVYLPLAAADFADFSTFADVVGLSGASVTAPFKVSAFEFADECDPVSRRIQSVNTLRRENNRWLGSNTDVTGFLAPLQSMQRVSGLRATILGAGGAARSVSVALTSAGVDVSIAARRREQAHAIAAFTGATIATWPPAPDSWDLLVNATPVGTVTSDESPLPADYRFPADGLVYDLVYNPPHTRLLQDAERAGCRTLGGLDMLVAQAQAQFAWWTSGRTSDRVMRDAAVKQLQLPEMQ